MSAYIWYNSEEVSRLASEIRENSEKVREAQFQEDMKAVYAEINADLTHGWLFKKTHPEVSTEEGAKNYFKWKKGLAKSSWMDYCSGEWQYHRVAVANYNRRVDADSAVTTGLASSGALSEVDKVFISCEALSRLKAKHKEVMELKKKFGIE